MAEYVIRNNKRKFDYKRGDEEKQDILIKACGYDWSY